MAISVIIASYNREGLLGECLRALRTQPFAASDEVVIADNGSTDGTRAIIEREADGFPVPLRYVLEPQPGKSRALARAVPYAQGDVLAFLDDDVFVAEDWLEMIRRGMADETVALLAGQVQPRWESPPPSWLRLKDGSAAFGKLTSPIALLHYAETPEDLGERTAVGGNMAVRRHAFEAVGGFATGLGKLRGTLLSGEDHELCLRIRQAGYRSIYWPAAVVRHWVPAERMRIRYYLRWFFWSGITNARLDREQGAPFRRLFGVPGFIWKRIPAAGARALATAVSGRSAEAVDHTVDAAYAVGYLAECLHLTRPRTTGREAERAGEDPGRVEG